MFDRSDGSGGFVDDHRDRDRKVRKREREMMAALAMEEVRMLFSAKRAGHESWVLFQHNRKMQQRLQLLDDVILSDTNF